jgi:F-type H+-transporting ATPase subunit gamma
MKAIETIKKITHAMRLIAMSSHAQLKHKEYALVNYVESIIQLLSKTYTSIASEHNPLEYLPHSKSSKQLIILVGSQKGLCGNFNTALIHYFEQKKYDMRKSDLELIVVGRKVVDHINQHPQATLLATYDAFSLHNLFSVSQEIFKQIMGAGVRYHTISVISNSPVSFFSQQPTTTEIIPLDHTNLPHITPPDEGYYWEQEPTEILTNIMSTYMQAYIQQLLFQSLLAEQAARFISMDGSTRNAKNLLDATRLHYNKLRQAKITKELTELTGSL